MLARVRSNLALGDLWSAARGGPHKTHEVLEAGFAGRFGFPHAMLFPSGRSALRALLGALDWREREVLCPAYICSEVPYAVTLAGNRVRFVDSAPDHFLPGVAQWRAAVTPRSAMAIVAPLFGYPIERGCEAVIRESAPNAFILYDEAQSFGVSDTNGPQAVNADGMLLSLGLGKMATALSGGLLLLRDRAIERAVREYRDANYAASGLGRALQAGARGLAVWLAFREPALSLADWVGRNFAIFPSAASDWLPGAMPEAPPSGEQLPSTYQARIGVRQLSQLDGFMASRRRVAQHYEDRLLQEGFRTFAAASVPTWTRYPMAVARRDMAVAALRKDGVQLSLFLPYSCAELSVYRTVTGRHPNAALWGRSMINLPNWYGLSFREVDRVLGSLLRLRDRAPEAVAWPS